MSGRHKFVGIIVVAAFVTIINGGNGASSSSEMVSHGDSELSDDKTCADMVHELTEIYKEMFEEHLEKTPLMEGYHVNQPYLVNAISKDAYAYQGVSLYLAEYINIEQFSGFTTLENPEYSVKIGFQQAHAHEIKQNFTEHCMNNASSLGNLVTKYQDYYASIDLDVYFNNFTELYSTIIAELGYNIADINEDLFFFRTYFYGFPFIADMIKLDFNHPNYVLKQDVQLTGLMYGLKQLITQNDYDNIIMQKQIEVCLTDLLMKRLVTMTQVWDDGILNEFYVSKMEVGNGKTLTDLQMELHKIRNPRIWNDVIYYQRFMRILNKFWRTLAEAKSTCDHKDCQLSLNVKVDILVQFGELSDICDLIIYMIKDGEINKNCRDIVSISYDIVNSFIVFNEFSFINFC